jgi:hypothetical protein
MLLDTAYCVACGDFWNGGNSSRYLSGKNEMKESSDIDTYDLRIYEEVQSIINKFSNKTGNLRVKFYIGAPVHSLFQRQSNIYYIF